MEARGLGSALVRGGVAGLVGTSAMTLSEHLEMRLTGRASSTVPGQVAQRLTGFTPHSDEAEARLSQAVHWGHGILMGVLRGAISLTGVRGLPATGIHYAAMWSGDAALYRMLGIAPPPWAWEPSQLGTDLLHKGVHAAVTGAVYDRLAPADEPT